MEVISYLIIATVFVVTMLYIASKLSGKSYDYKDYKLYLLSTIFIISITFNYLYVNGFIRVILSVLVYTIVIKILLKEKIINSLVLTLYYELIIVISETIFALIMNLLLGMGSIAIVNSLFGNLGANIIIDIISIVLINIKLTQKIYKKIVTIINKINAKHIILMCLFSLIIINVLEAALYYEFNFRYLLIFNTFIIIFCFSITIYSFYTNNKYNKVYSKYNTTINSLKEYEDILDRYRITNHENKNELLTIRNMLKQNDDSTITYIDKILNNQIKDDEKLMHQTSVIPSGGLRGLIYSKILLMKTMKISCKINISPKVKTVDLIDLDQELILDICKIIGVYLDNSIEAVKDLSKRNISIEMFIADENLAISIGNNFEGTVDFGKIEEKGYTSKGKSHGYGLFLAREIIAKNNKLYNEKQIDNKYFTQTLYIKIK